jgi:hypothetical protein
MVTVFHLGQRVRLTDQARADERKPALMVLTPASPATTSTPGRTGSCHFLVDQV